MNKRHFHSKGFQPLALATQGVEIPWEVSVIFTDVLICQTKVLIVILLNNKKHKRVFN